MGLDIVAYRGLEKIDAVFDADGDPIDPVTRLALSGDFVLVRLSDDFPERADGVEDGGVYRYAESFHFNAGAYSSYNRWRESLARLAGYPAIEYRRNSRVPPELSRAAAAWRGLCDGAPFVDLVNFSDCEGVIGPVASQRLFADFETHKEKAAAFQFGDYDFFSIYKKFLTAFALASYGGAVVFC